jgi:hypothetical protein
MPHNRAFSRRFFHHEKTPQFFSHSSNNPFIHSSGFDLVAAMPLHGLALAPTCTYLHQVAPTCAKKISG